MKKCLLLVTSILLISCKSEADNAVAKFESYTAAICACKDPACVDKVAAEKDVFERESTKKLQGSTPTEAQAKRVMASMEKYEKCQGQFKLDAGAQFGYEALVKGIAEAKTKLGDGSIDAMACASVATSLEMKELIEASKNPNFGNVRKAMEEGAKVCLSDAPIAILERETKAAEAARLAKPTETVLTECFNAEYTMALESAAKNSGIAAKVAAIKTRFDAVCPATP
jgi:hypothetical protein